jgi:hypothetical protein
MEMERNNIGKWMKIVMFPKGICVNKDHNSTGKIRDN